MRLEWAHCKLITSWWFRSASHQVDCLQANILHLHRWIPMEFDFKGVRFDLMKQISAATYGLEVTKFPKFISDCREI